MPPRRPVLRRKKAAKKVVRRPARRAPVPRPAPRQGWVRRTMRAIGKPFAVTGKGIAEGYRFTRNSFRKGRLAYHGWRSHRAEMRLKAIPETEHGLKRENALAWTTFGKRMIKRELDALPERKMQLEAMAKKHRGRANLLRGRYRMP